MKKTPPILFFDGHCNLCNSFIDVLVRNDPQHKVLIASLQGNTAKNELEPSVRENMKSVVLKEGDRIFEKSAAVFRVTELVRGPFIFLLPFSVLPKAFSDWVYDCVATNRYRIFGRKDSCRLPTEDEKKHFLP